MLPITEDDMQEMAARYCGNYRRSEKTEIVLLVIHRPHCRECSSPQLNRTQMH
jgi:hypothetical protein